MPTETCSLVAVYEGSLIILDQDKNISTNWLMENAIAHLRDAALNSKVIATYKDDFGILGQDKTISSNDRLMETPQGNAYAIAHSRNVALNSNVIAIYKDNFGQEQEFMDHLSANEGVCNHDFKSHLFANEGAQIQSLPKSKHYSYSTSKEANASASHTSNTSIIDDSPTEGATDTISFLLSVAITIFTFRTFLPGHVKCFALPAGITRKLFKSKSNRYRFSNDFLTRYTNKYKTQLYCAHNGTHNFSSQQRQLFISQYCKQQIETLKLAQELHQVPYPDTDISDLWSRFRG
eukprot:scaffold21893_cov85-Skeletonema_dohrnii-CCMP3373.AAC.1